MITGGGSEEELAARKAASEKLLSGVVTGIINEAYETESRRKRRPMMVFEIGVTDANGLQRTIFDNLTDSPQAGIRLRHACAAVGVLAEFEAKRITPEMFAGRAVRIKLKIERGKNGYPSRSVVEDYLPAEASPVVNLRAS